MKNLILSLVVLFVSFVGFSQDTLLLKELHNLKIVSMKSNPQDLLYFGYLPKENETDLIYKFEFDLQIKYGLYVTYLQSDNDSDILIELVSMQDIEGEVEFPIVMPLSVSEKLYNDGELGREFYIYSKLMIKIYN